MIIGDLKGNMGDAVRKLAEACGRGKEVVEYGCGPLAEVKNLLAYMGDEDIRSFFEGLVEEVASGDSRSWGLKGAQAAADIAILCRYLSHAVDKRFWPTFSMVCELMDNPFEACKLYTIFLENFYDENDIKQKKFVSSIEGNAFHVLRKLERKDGKFLPIKAEKTYSEQTTWNAQAFRMASRSFLEAPGVAEHFSAHGAKGIDLEKDIMSGKIILLRFDALTGKVGATLTRRLLAEAYRIVLRTTIEQRGGKLFFVILDEFQEFADFSDNAGSDKNFVALAREFGGCILAATQSKASLGCKVGNDMLVESFIGNCNNIISFYGHDTATQELVNRYDPKTRLNKLKPGQVFAATYDSATRTHRHGLDTVNKAYRETAEILASVTLPAPIVPERPRPLSLFGLIEGLEQELERKKRETEEAEKARKAAEEVERRRQDEEEKRSTAAVARMLGCPTDADRDFPYEEDDPASNVEPDPDDYEYDQSEEEAEKKESDMGKEDNGFAAELRKEFPELFAEDFHELGIPKGWREFVKSALRMFCDMDFGVKIRAMSMNSQGMLKTYLDDNSGHAREILDRLFAPAAGLCMICGKKLPEDVVGKTDDDNEPEFVPVCGDCLQKYDEGGKPPFETPEGCPF